MPNRLLRDCTCSENVDKLSAHAEVLFYRLMMKADDYGSFFGNSKLIKANCFPLRLDTVRDADISRWIDELLKAGLIAVYTHAGKEYLRIKNFGQRLRNKKKKFPDCPPELIDSEPPQVAADGGKSPPEVEENTEVEVEVEPHRQKLLSDKAYTDPILMNWRLTGTQLEAMISDFELHLLSQTKRHKDYGEYKSHFHNWASKKSGDYQQAEGKTKMVN